MPPAETNAILRDVFVIATLAAGLATGIYALLRHASDTAWNLEGNVLTRPYGIPDAVVAVLLLALFGLVFFLPETSTGGAEGAGGSGPELTVSGLVLQMVSMLLLVTIILLYLGVVRGLNAAEMFGLRQMPLRRALLCAVIGLAGTALGGALILAIILQWNGGALPDTSAQEAVEAFEKSGSPQFRLMLGFMAVITAPLTEEVLFRGFLYGVIKRGTDRWFAAIFTAVIFSVVHMHVGTAPQLFLLGLGLAVAYEQTGCLLVPVFMHAIFNAWSITMLTVVSASSP